MNTIKNYLLAIGLTVLSISAFAETKPTSKKSETVQIQTYLEALDFKEFISKDTKLVIHFMINDYNEIVVLTTNNEDLDGYLKTKLNDKKLELSNLNYNVGYYLPIEIKLKN